MAREGGKDRGLFQRKDSPAWWIRWTCPYGHEHQEKIGPKSLARMVYQRRKVAVKAEGYCLTQDREQRRREQPALFRDVDLATGTLRVTRPKSKKHEVIPLNSTAFAVLAALPQDDPRLFPHLPRKMSDLFIRYAHKAGLPDVTFHCLRDTYISRLAPHCTTPTLMALARHRDYRTTRRYVQVDGDHQRQAVEYLVPDLENDHVTVTEIVTATIKPS